MGTREVMKKTIVINDNDKVKVNNVFNGEFFIIPTSASEFSDDADDYWSRDINKEMEKFGFTPKPGDKFVEVWAASPDDENSNWSAHWWEFQKMTGLENDRFPLYLPYKFLKNLEEGDTLELRRNDGVTFKITANQLSYRYRRFGRFEKVVNQLVPFGE